MQDGQDYGTRFGIALGKLIALVFHFRRAWASYLRTKARSYFMQVAEFVNPYSALAVLCAPCNKTYADYNYPLIGAGLRIGALGKHEADFYI